MQMWKHTTAFSKQHLPESCSPVWRPQTSSHLRVKRFEPPTLFHAACFHSLFINISFSWIRIDNWLTAAEHFTFRICFLLPINHEKNTLQLKVALGQQRSQWSQQIWVIEIALKYMCMLFTQYILYTWLYRFIHENCIFEQLDVYFSPSCTYYVLSYVLFMAYWAEVSMKRHSFISHSGL